MARFMGAHDQSGHFRHAAWKAGQRGIRGYGRGGVTLTVNGIVDFQRYFQGLPEKLQKKAIKKTLTEVKKAMVKHARSILGPYKESGALLKSLGSTKKPRYPRRNPKTGDWVTTVRPRLGFATIYEGRSRDPRHYGHLVDSGFVPHARAVVGKKTGGVVHGWSGIDFYEKILKSGKQKFVPIAKKHVAALIRKEKANHIVGWTPYD